MERLCVTGGIDDGSSDNDVMEGFLIGNRVRGGLSLTATLNGAVCVSKGRESPFGERSRRLYQICTGVNENFAALLAEGEKGQLVKGI